MSKLRPLNDRVVVKLVDRPKQSAGGILIPDGAGELPTEATVIAVGPGERDSSGNRIPLDIKPGDKVLLEKYAGIDFKLEGEKLVVVAAKAIAAVLE